MRASRRFGVLSDQYIRENYADCFLPIRVDKLHSVRQKPANSYVNTSGKRVKEYNSIAPVIPQFIAENNSRDQTQLDAIKSDLIRTSANAKSDLNILQPPRKREGTLQEDIGFTKISSMANAEDPKFGKIDKDFVSDELEDQAAYAAYGDKVEYNTLRGEMASRHKEDMSFAGRGVKAQLAQILDPNVSNQLFLAGQMQNVPQSPLFAKPDPRPAQPGGRQQPTNLFQTQQRAEGPPGPQGPPPGGGPAPSNEVGGEGIFSEPTPGGAGPSRGMTSTEGPIVGQTPEGPMRRPGDPIFEYRSAEVNRGEREPKLFTGNILNKSSVLAFLNKELIMEGATAEMKKEYLKSLPIGALSNLLQDYFRVKPTFGHTPFIQRRLR